VSAIDTITARAAPTASPAANGHASTAAEPKLTRSVPPLLAPRIVGLEVGDPETTHSQDDVLDRLGLAGDEFAEGVFARSGVKRRNLNLGDAFLTQTLQGRAQAVEDELMRRSMRVVDRLGVDPQLIGMVVTSSLYSLGCPTLAHRLVDHYAMDPATDKYHVTGVGCASAVPLMRMAAGSMHMHPGKDALIVAAESMSGILMQATEEDPRAKTVGSALFGDGCAAAVLSCDPAATGPAILATHVHQIGGTLGAVALSFSAQDSYLHLARELPDLAGAGLPDVTARFLREQGLAHAEIDHWILHPGGRRILENVQRALALTDAQTAVSWDALANHGNVGTPSIFYVLEQTIASRDPQPGQRGLAVTIGPGVTVGLMLLQW
jgi:predicted naringenin-chalcone synthase